MRDYESMSDFEINRAIAIVEYCGSEDVVAYDGKVELHTRYATDHGMRVDVSLVDYCNNPADIMPLAIEAGISLIYGFDGDYSACSGIEVSTYGADELLDEVRHKNPYRAAAIVWLKINDEKLAKADQGG